MAYIPRKGDRVKYEYMREVWIGTLHRGDMSWFIEFDDPFPHGHSAGNTGRLGHCWYTNNFSLAEPQVILTKEEKVSLKCKKLWNNSNYVKNNPTLAY